MLSPQSGPWSTADRCGRARPKAPAPLLRSGPPTPQAACSQLPVLVSPRAARGRPPCLRQVTPALGWTPPCGRSLRGTHACLGGRGTGRRGWGMGGRGTGDRGQGTGARGVASCGPAKAAAHALLCSPTQRCGNAPGCRALGLSRKPSGRQRGLLPVSRLASAHPPGSS